MLYNRPLTWPDQLRKSEQMTLGSVSQSVHHFSSCTRANLEVECLLLQAFSPGEEGIAWVVGKQEYQKPWFGSSVCLFSLSFSFPREVPFPGSSFLPSINQTCPFPLGARKHFLVSSSRLMWSGREGINGCLLCSLTERIGPQFHLQSSGAR